MYILSDFVAVTKEILIRDFISLKNLIFDASHEQLKVRI